MATTIEKNNSPTPLNYVINEGWLKPAKISESPNFNERPAKTAISLIVVHNISLPPSEFGACYIEDFFLNQLDTTKHRYFEHIQDMQVSAHCLIKRNGEVIQFVNFNARAWHAGQSCFEGRDNCNDFSIGLELEGTDDLPFTANQYHALTGICQQLLKTYPTINPDNITGHSDIAPGRKTDPGGCFNWGYFRSNLNKAKTS